MRRSILSVLVTLSLASCSSPTPSPTITPEPSIAPTRTHIPSDTPTATVTPTKTKIPTATPTATSEPIFVTIGSPFPPEWGTPRIWANDSFNGPFDRSRMDMHHGHMDVAVPAGYSHHDGFYLDDHPGDVIAPISGIVVPYQDHSGGLHLYLPNNTYIDGILNALKFAGIENPSLKEISDLRIDLGHLKDVIPGNTKKGDVIAEIDPLGFNYQGQYYESGVAFQVSLRYSGVEYLLSPTLFTLDTMWDCYTNSAFDCEPEPHDYAP